jgi:protein TonB
MEGVVAVAVEVLSTGRVGQVRVQQSSGAAELDAAALRAAREWRFDPATGASGPVASWITVRFRYTLTDN